MNDIDIFCIHVHLKYAVRFGKNDGRRIVISEIVIHSYFVEKRQVFDYDSLVKFECIIRKCISGLLPLENEELILFLLHSNEVLSTDNCKPVFALRYLETNDFIWLSRVGVQKLNWDLAALLHGKGIKHEHLINSCNKESVHSPKLYSFGTREITIMYLNSEIMHILSTVDFEAPLVGLITDAVSNSSTEHHLVATHVVVHAVFQLGHKSCRVNKIEVN